MQAAEVDVLVPDVGQLDELIAVVVAQRVVVDFGDGEVAGVGRDGIDEEAYVEMRTARDAQLEMPKLIIPSVQVNMRAGEMPEPDADGKRYLKVPVDEL